VVLRSADGPSMGPRTRIGRRCEVADGADPVDAVDAGTAPTCHRRAMGGGATMSNSAVVARMWGHGWMTMRPAVPPATAVSWPSSKAIAAAAPHGPLRSTR
jgi:hypothetical protein